jgi:zinc/manganese transport system ATP-binding protein
VVRAEGLAAAYGPRRVWERASFSVGRGQFVAVLGPNGAGKSTLFRLLLGLLRPAAGRLQVLGRAPRLGDPAIGYVPQRPSAEAARWLEAACLVRLGYDGHRPGLALGRARRAAARAAEAALAAVGAEDLAGRRVGELSGGQHQRLALARALVGEPSLLLLDEPMAHLDLRGQAALAELVGSLVRSRGLSALIVTHDVNPLLGQVDLLLYLARGRLLAGRPEEVVRSDTLSALYGSPVEVLVDSRGRRFVVGLEEEVSHPH